MSWTSEPPNLTREQFIRAVNAWCRGHDALVVELQGLYPDGSGEFFAAVILHDDQEWCVRHASVSDVLAALNERNDAINGPRTAADVHAAVMAGLVGME